MARPKKKTAAAVVKDIKRQTRRKFNAEEKIRIVLEGIKREKFLKRQKNTTFYKQLVSCYNTCPE